MQSDGGMAMAFVDEVPATEVAKFRDADLVFTQRLDSFLSWAMMYVTSSPIDHTAVYVEEGKILHMTLSGSRVHSLRSLAKGCRLIVVRMNREQLSHFWHEAKIEEIRLQKNLTWVHGFPPKFQIFIGGLSIIHGMYSDRFKLHKWIELFLTIIIFSYLISYFSGFIAVWLVPIFSFGFMIYFNIRNAMLYILGKRTPAMSHPDIGYRSFFKAGGLMFTRIGPLAVFENGILPLNVVLGLGRERPDDSSDDQLKKAREFFRNLVEGWNVEGFAEKAEDNNANQQEHK